MNSDKHTPEPWEVSCEKEDIVFNDIFSMADKHPILVANTHNIHLDFSEREANAIRIVQCVNAMQGIENPSEWVSSVHNLISFLDEYSNDIEAQGHAIRKFYEKYPNDIKGF